MLIAGLLGFITEEAALKAEWVQQTVKGLPSKFRESQTTSFLRTDQHVLEAGSIREELPGFFSGYKPCRGACEDFLQALFWP